MNDVLTPVRSKRRTRVFSRAHCIASLGDFSNRVASRLSHRMTRFCHGPVPVQIGYCPLTKVDNDSHKASATSESVQDRAEAPSLGNWVADATKSILETSAQLSSSTKQGLALAQGLEFTPGRAHVFLLVDSCFLKSWNEIHELVSAVRAEGYRVVGIVTQPTTDPSFDLEQLLDLGNRAPAFNQLFLVTNRDQQGSAVDSDEQMRLVLDYLSDRIIDAGDRQLGDVLDQHDSIRGAGYSGGSQVENVWSLGCQTLSIDIDEVKAILRRADLRLEFGGGNWPESDEKAIKAHNSEELRAWEAMDSSPIQILKRLLPDREPKSDPSMTQLEVDQKVKAFEKAVWDQVSDALIGNEFDFVEGYRRLWAAETLVRNVNDRFRLNALQAGRLSKIRSLRGTRKTKVSDRSLTEKIKSPRFPRLRYFAIGMVVLLAIGLIAFVFSRPPQTTNQMIGWIIGLLVFASLSVVGLVLAWQYKVQETKWPPAPRPPGRFNMPQIRDAELQLAALLDRLGRSRRSFVEFAKRWRDTVASERLEIGPPSSLLGRVPESAWAALSLRGGEDADRILKQNSTDLRRSMLEAIRTGRSPNSVLEHFNRCLEGPYQFLDRLSTPELLQMLQIEVSESTMSGLEDVPAAWQIPDSLLIREPDYLPVLSYPESLGDAQSRYHVVRLYKFCHGINLRPSTDLEQ